MKKFLENHSTGLFLAFLSALAAVIGLCGWIYLDFIGDEGRENLYRIDAESAAEHLMDVLEADDRILSYYYAREVRDYAARAGEREMAQWFASLAENIRVAGIDPQMGETVRTYLANGEKTTSPDGEKLAPVTVMSEPEEVAAIRRTDALATAEELMGASDILTLAVRCKPGQLLFSCTNGYAVIDEKTSLPLEMGISLPQRRDNNRLTPEECVAQAEMFLHRYAPAVSGTVIRVIPGEDAVTAEFSADGKPVTVSVRRDTGKIVRYVAQ